MKRLKVGIIGLGWIAETEYIPSLLNMQDVEVAAAADTNPQALERFRQRYGSTKCFGSVEEMISGTSIDCGIVLTTKKYTGITCKKLLEAGIPVLTEKPIAVSMKEARENAALAREKGLVFMVAMNRRFTDVYTLAKEEFKDKKISLCIAEKVRNSSYKGERPLLDYGIHSLDILRWICGSEVMEMDAKAIFDTLLFEKALTASMKFADGALGVFHMTGAAGGWSEKLTLLGEDTTVEIDAPHSIRITKNGTTLEKKTCSSGFFDSCEVFGFKNELLHFFDCVREKKETFSPAEDAIVTLELIDRIYRKAGLPGLENG
jgi:virulence factor